MNDCPPESQIATLLSGIVAPDDTGRLRAHVDHCSRCFALAAGLRKVGEPEVPARFSFVRPLGAGGMGTVYEAIDHQHDVHVAIKVLNHTAPDAILRFKREFRALQDLHHPNLVRLGDLFAENGRWFFTMELLRGVRFVEYARSGPPAGQPARLRHAFRQLVHAITALHGAGKVHRDVKSSNVIVTDDDRVVLLDLGLVLDQYDDCESTGGNVMGTLAYMAPEQAAAQRVGPEADWYAAGVLLYQALTGQLPVTGDARELAARKWLGQITPPRELDPEIDPELSELCMMLLSPEPGARPVASDILRVLGASRSPLSAPARAAVFVGRARELEVLAQSLADTRRGQPVAVVIRGDSGIGKSAIVQQFADSCRRRGAVVLAGRCYERESVPFKAVDGVVDALSRHLARVPGEEAAAVLPRQVALLARVFPVLARVRPIADAPAGFDVPDPQELRDRAFAALRELLARMADRHPLVISIDDVHWADADSVALLTDLFRPGDAPAALVLVTVRGSAGTSEVAHVEAARAALGPDVRELALAPLRADDACQLASLLIAQAPEPADLDPAAVAGEASGHPMFIDALIRHPGAGRAGAMRLDEVLWARIAQLPEATRHILQLAALSGGPLRQRTCAVAAHLDIAVFEGHVGALRAGNLLCTTGTSPIDFLEPYHDRVRAAVVAHTSEDAARTMHRQLALALEDEPHGDAEALALHWRETGDHVRAARYTAEAAAHAARTLAFDRAAQLYRSALRLRDAESEPDGAIEQRLRVELGHALANAGRGAEAAEVYVRAADAATAADALDLRRRACEELVRTGHVDRGVATLRDTLQPLGISIARTPIQAMLSLLRRRLRLRLRGLAFAPRALGDVPALLVMKIDLCWSLSSSFAFVDPLIGSELGALHLQLALEAGEPSRMCRALAGEALYAASVGAPASARRLVSRAAEIATRLERPYLAGVVSLLSGISAALQGEFIAAHTDLTAAQDQLRADTTGAAWEINTATRFGLHVSVLLGRLKDVSQRTHELRRAAESRGDLHSSASLRTGLFNLVWLLRDEPAQARQHADAALHHWSQRGFHVQHFWQLYAQVEIDLYQGDGGGARARLLAHRQAISSARLLRLPYFRIPVYDLQARAAIAAAAGPGAPVGALIAEAKRCIRRLRRDRLDWGDGLASLLEAGVDQLRGDTAGATGHLIEAIAVLGRASMALHVAVARYRLAELRGDAALASEAAAWFAEQDVVAPARMVAMLAPVGPR